MGVAVSSELLSVGFSRLRELGEPTPHHGPILFPPGSVCLPCVRLPSRASLRRRRRVHPGVLRILRQPHLQAIWLWSVGCGGSKGFGYNTMVSSPNSFYGGYHYAG